MATKASRRSFTVEQKVAILRRHLVDGVAVSDLCDEYKLQPSLFYLWQRQAMENLAASFEGKGRRGESGRQAALEREVERLRARLAKKEQVIAEIAQEYVELKKNSGED